MGALKSALEVIPLVLRVLHCCTETRATPSGNIMTVYTLISILNGVYIPPRVVQYLAIIPSNLSPKTGDGSAVLNDSKGRLVRRVP